MPPTELAFIDLSGIAHRFYAVAGKEPDPDWCSQQIVAKVRELTTQHPHAAVCFDTPPYKRRELVPSYKANRPAHEPALYHQIALAREVLQADGYPCWGVKGYEADDVIASAVQRTLDLDPEITALIISADKDLVQLVGPRVRVLSTATGLVLDETGVIARFGVSAAQMHDYLCLVGDTADNIKGARNIGPKGAAQLLGAWPWLTDIYEAIDRGDAVVADTIKPAMLASLAEFRSRYAEVSSLIELVDTVPLPFEEMAAERTVAQLAPEPPPVIEAPIVTDESAANVSVVPLHTSGPLQVVNPAPLIVPPWERQLDPHSREEAKLLAIDMFASKLFSTNGGFGNAPACLAAIMMGRELGMSAIASLRGIHVIEGRPSLSAGLMVALVLRSGLAEYFEPVTISDTACTFVTKRKGARKEVTLTHTIKMAEQAGLVKPNSNWVKVPTDMLVARCQSRLARLVYPDLLAGLYSVEEVEEFARAA